MGKFRLYDNESKSYVDLKLSCYLIREDGTLWKYDGKDLILCDPIRYVVEPLLLIIDGKEMFSGDIISVNGKYPKILGSDNFGFYLENVEDIKNRSWMETKQRPSPVWFAEFTGEFEITGNIHDKICAKEVDEAIEKICEKNKVDSVYGKAFIDCCNREEKIDLLKISLTDKIDEKEIKALLNEIEIRFNEAEIVWVKTGCLLAGESHVEYRVRRKDSQKSTYIVKMVKKSIPESFGIILRFED